MKRKHIAALGILAGFIIICVGIQFHDSDYTRETFGTIVILLGVGIFLASLILYFIFSGQERTEKLRQEAAMNTQTDLPSLPRFPSMESIAALVVKRAIRSASIELIIIGVIALAISLTVEITMGTQLRNSDRWFIPLLGLAGLVITAVGVLCIRMQWKAVFLYIWLSLWGLAALFLVDVLSPVLQSPSSQDDLSFPGIICALIVIVGIQALSTWFSLRPIFRLSQAATGEEIEYAGLFFKALRQPHQSNPELLPISIRKIYLLSVTILDLLPRQYFAFLSKQPFLLIASSDARHCFTVNLDSMRKTLIETTIRPNKVVEVDIRDSAGQPHKSMMSDIHVQRLQEWMQSFTDGSLISPGSR